MHRESYRKLIKTSSASASTPAKLDVTNVYKISSEWSKKHPNPISFNRGRGRQLPPK
jgi:hypothetical protein